MPKHVCNGALLNCSFGAAPSTMIVLPVHRTMTSNQPAANITDGVPLTNIQPFGLCAAPTNPAVIAATSAALGVFTPAPCVPATVPPWITGAPTVILDGMPALDDTSKLMCTWLGVVTVSFPGQVTEDIP